MKKANRRIGDSLNGVKFSAQDVARFEKYFDKTEGCWLWHGAGNGNGYGIFRFKGRKRFAHRLAYLLRHGALPVGLDICHSCDIPQCVNPAHLFAGSVKDNVDDMCVKRRHGSVKLRENWARGERQGSSKLKEFDVIAIRQMYAGKKMTDFNTTAIAMRYGVTWRTIHMIVTRISWKHLP